MTIVAREDQDEREIGDKIGCGFFIGLAKTNSSSSRYYKGEDLSPNIGLVGGGVGYIKNKMQARCKMVVNNILSKIEKPVQRK